MTATDWRETTLGELITVAHGYAFRGEFFGSKGSHIVLTPGNFLETGGFRDKGDDEKWYDGPIPDRYVLDSGSLVIAMTEQTPGLLGSSALIPRRERYLHNQRIGLVAVKDATQVDKNFIYYLFNTEAVRAQITASATGTKIRHTAPKRIAAVRVRIPDLPEQARIASALRNYDELLELNERRIALADEAGRLLYERWFVRCDTPPALSLGRTGRGTRHLGELAEITMGQSPASKHYNVDGQGLPFHQGVTDFGTQYLNHRVYCTEGRTAGPGDIVCSVRAPVGRLNVTLDRIVIGRGLAALKSRTGHQSLLRRQMQALFFKEDLFGSGTIFAAVTRKQLESLEVTVGPDALMDAFEVRARTLDAQMATLFQQARYVRVARDLLLPRLMSGAVRLRANEPPPAIAA